MSPEKSFCHIFLSHPWCWMLGMEEGAGRAQWLPVARDAGQGNAKQTKQICWFSHRQFSFFYRKAFWQLLKKGGKKQQSEEGQEI